MNDLIKSLESFLFSPESKSEGSYVYAKVYSNGKFKLFVSYLDNDVFLIQDDSGYFENTYNLRGIRLGRGKEDDFVQLENQIFNWIKINFRIMPDKYFREITPEIEAIRQTLSNWSVQEWNVFKNGRFLMLPATEYAFLLFDAGFKAGDSPEKARDLV